MSRLWPRTEQDGYDGYDARRYRSGKSQRLSVLRPLLFESIGQTLEMVLITLVVGGFLGLVLGVVLYGTGPGNLLKTRYSTASRADVIVNIIRPIPFIIFLAAMQPLTIKVVGTSIGTVAAIFPMIIMCHGRYVALVEQNRPS